MNIRDRDKAIMRQYFNYHDPIEVECNFHQKGGHHFIETTKSFTSKTEVESNNLSNESLNLESKNECSSVTSKSYNAFETMTQEEYDEIPDLI